MKKILALTCFLFVGLVAFAQIKRNVVTDGIVVPITLPAEVLNGGKTMDLSKLNLGSISSNKTSGDGEDRPQNAYFKDVLDGTLSKCTIQSFPQLQDGYLNGSFGPTELTFNDGSKRDMIIQEHAIQFKVSPHSTKKFVWLSNVYVAFSEVPNVQGDADKFKVRVYPTSKNGSSTTIENPVNEFTFTVEDRYSTNPDLDNADGLLLKNVIEPSDKSEANALKSNVSMYLLSVEAKTIDSDDRFCFYFTNPTKECDVDDDYSWLVRFQDVNQDTFSFWANMNQVFGFPSKDNPKLDPDIPVFVPILTYETPNGIEDNLDESLGQSRNLILYGAGPNPAVEFTNIKYEFTKNANATIRVMDASGKEVHNSGEISIAKGIHNYHLDTAKFPCGIYTYMIQSHNGAMGGKFIVNK